MRSLQQTSRQPGVLLHPSGKRRQQVSCMLDGRFEALMNDLVIGFEQIKANNHALVQLPELRKVDVVFDSVMVVEVLREGIEPRNEGLLQL